MASGVCLLLSLVRLSWAELASEDWLVGKEPTSASLKEIDGALVLSNGLVTRRFLTHPNWASVSLESEADENLGEVLRGFSPEARVSIGCPRPGRSLLPYAPDVLEGVTDPNETGSSKASAGIAIGGLRGQARYAYLDVTRWNLTAGVDDFRYAHHETRAPVASWEWTPGQRNSIKASWPPRGLQLRVTFKAPQKCACFCDLSVTVVYEIYDGLPTITKWVELAMAPSSQSLLIERLITEELHVAVHAKQRLHVETDFMPRKTDWAFAQGPASDPHGGSYNGNLMNYPTWWVDPDYEDDLSDQSLHADRAYRGLLLQLQYPLGPWQPIAPEGTFSSFKTYMTLMDTDNTERQSLTRRKVVRTLFPQVTEAPLYFYTTDASSQGLRRVAQQCAETGFEAIIISFGSGFDPSSTNTTYIARMKADVEYVHSLGLLIGGYTLMQNPPGLVGNDYCKPPDGKSGYNTHIADFTTEFHKQYRSDIMAFIEATGIDILETDGPYEGATCAVTNQSGVAHQNNSQVAQFRATVDFYREVKAKFNTYLTVPDPYWMSGGTNKEPMGYTDAWNKLPVDDAGNSEYLTLGRMYLFDGTFHKPTSAGWLAFELSRTPPPMQQHAQLLEEAIASYLGQGNIACYRGPELYDADSPLIRDMWKLWVAHYKRYRRILMSDMLHIARPTGANIEAVLHVDASAEEIAAFGNLFNPSSRTLSKTLQLPLYYAGFVSGSLAKLSWGGSLAWPAAWPVPAASMETVSEDYIVRVNVTMAPRSFLWVAVQRVQPRFFV